MMSGRWDSQIMLKRYNLGHAHRTGNVFVSRQLLYPVSCTHRRWTCQPHRKHSRDRSAPTRAGRRSDSRMSFSAAAHLHGKSSDLTRPGSTIEKLLSTEQLSRATKLDLVPAYQLCLAHKRQSARFVRYGARNMEVAYRLLQKP